jgi:hypothetical protein
VTTAKLLNSTYRVNRTWLPPATEHTLACEAYLLSSPKELLRSMLELTDEWINEKVSNVQGAPGTPEEPSTILSSSGEWAPPEDSEIFMKGEEEHPSVVWKYRVTSEFVEYPRSGSIRYAFTPRWEVVSCNDKDAASVPSLVAMYREGELCVSEVVFTLELFEGAFLSALIGVVPDLVERWSFSLGSSLDSLKRPTLALTVWCRGRNAPWLRGGRGKNTYLRERLVSLFELHSGHSFRLVGENALTNPS